jgi:hypothetical protein
MTTTEKIKKPGLTVFLCLHRLTKSETPAVTQLKENRITKGRRVIKRLQIMTDCIMLIRIVILFCIAAVAASALLNVLLRGL